MDYTTPTEVIEYTSFDSIHKKSGNDNYKESTNKFRTIVKRKKSSNKMNKKEKNE